MMADDSLHSSSGGNDDVAECSRLTEELENYLYVHRFAGTSSLGALKIPPLNPSSPPGTTVDDALLYWIGVDRKRYATLPFFVRQAKTQAAYERELQALEQDLIPSLDPPYTRQTIEDIRNLLMLMDAFDRITGIQNRVHRLMKQEVTEKLQL